MKKKKKKKLRKVALRNGGSRSSNAREVLRIYGRTVSEIYKRVKDITKLVPTLSFAGTFWFNKKKSEGIFCLISDTAFGLTGVEYLPEQRAVEDERHLWRRERRAMVCGAKPRCRHYQRRPSDHPTPVQPATCLDPSATSRSTPFVSLRRRYRDPVSRLSQAPPPLPSSLFQLQIRSSPCSLISGSLLPP